MRIVFCGTPDFAVPSLERLLDLAPRHEVVAVVSQPDRRKGRSGTPTPPPVAAAALRRGFPRERLFQPPSINRRAILDSLRALAPDVLCVIAYGNLLKESALNLARLCPINAHASLLPRHRGAAPIQAALLAGDSETGVCVMKMELGLDTGPVMLRKTIPIGPEEDAGSLHDRLAALSADAFAEAIEILDTGSATFEPQDDSKASYAAKLEKDSGRIDWTRSAAELHRLVRAMNPWPGAWTAAVGPDGASPIRLRVARATVVPAGGLAPGQGRADAATVTVGCGDGALRISELQPEGKRQMTVPEFLRGGGRRLTGESRWM